MKFIFLWSFRKETLPCMLSLHLPIYKKTSSFMLNKKCNCSGVPTFKSQREGHQSNQKLLHSLSTLSASLSALKGHIFHKAHPKSWNWLFAFLNLYQHAKNQFIPSVHSSETANFRVRSHDWPHPFLTMPTPKCFACMNLY